MSDHERKQINFLKWFIMKRMYCISKKLLNGVVYHYLHNQEVYHLVREVVSWEEADKINKV